MAYILKSHEIEMKTPYVLDLTKVRSEGQEGSADGETDRVRMVENNPQYTIIEVTCGCGQKTYVRCDH